MKLGSLARLFRRDKRGDLVSFEAQIATSGLSIPEWIERCRTHPRLYGDPSQETLRLIGTRPDLAADREATIAAANRILDHRFDLLGSGLFLADLPDVPPMASGYRCIDWHRDPVRGLCFPRDVPHKAWDLYKMRPGNADIKYPWELARCQHWPTLGQAYRLTGDRRFAIEMVRQLDDFMAANPVGIGINWTCTMDVALRALNWALGLQTIRECRFDDPEVWARAYRALFAHGVFIRDNLENTYEVTSNHFLSNVVGLFYLAETFADLPIGADWRRFSRQALEQEMAAQVLEDGADFESSIPYHRLVTELFLGAARLAQFVGQPLSPEYRTKLTAMVDYLAAILRPDGLMPQVGDADDGRLHILSGYGNWRPQDPRHLFAPAALTLDRPDWWRFADRSGAWEALWWGFVPDPAALEESLPSSCVGFPDAGHFVYRKDGTYLLVTNSVVGTKGFGNHKHNDQMSFEFHVGGTPLVVDPGSYVYTSDFAARNAFRSTASHNTVMVDGVEQNEMRPDWIFRLFDSGAPETVEFSDKEKYIQYHGRHVGYRRLANPVIHERILRLLKDAGVLLIFDRFAGEGRHRLAWHFHCAPGVSVDAVNGSSAWLKSGAGLMGMLSLDGLQAMPGQGWYSPSYGVREVCPVIDFRDEARLAPDAGWAFAIAPVGWLAEPKNIAAIADLRRDLIQGAMS